MQNVLEILIWYKKNFRELPFRSTKNPYMIWLAEVIMQQTQVNQGLRYYHAFIDKFPSISDLAKAKELDILKLWQGLGYYSRARNLLKTAQIVENEYNGLFPNNYQNLMKLPGIGDYTASAILSMAYNKPYPVLDGNVFRFLSRLYDIDLPINQGSSRKVFKEILNTLIENQDPALFNNAMMEMGAVMCKPLHPNCSVCPVQTECLAKKNNSIQARPVKIGKIIQQHRYFNFFYITYKGSFYLQKRESKDIWQNMFQLPLIETKTTPFEKELDGLLFGDVLKSQSITKGKTIQLKHILTHQVIHAKMISISLSRAPQFKKTGLIAVNFENYRKYPIPVLVEKFLLSL